MAIPRQLDLILKGVSRSFYLSLAWLPRKVRPTMALAFLACKGADTLADTTLLSEKERLHWLDAYRELFAEPGGDFAESIAKSIAAPGGGSRAEKELVENLPLLMKTLGNLPPADWTLVQDLVLELTQGMQTDLTFFPPADSGQLKAFTSGEELERYTYLVAGCVGRFWTRVLKLHCRFAARFGPEAEDLGERLGKGLQMVNILRDLPRDLRKGRCYLPQSDLQAAGLSESDLLYPAVLPRTKPLLLAFSAKAREALAAYRPYTALHPFYALRLKAAVRLPARLGIQTLRLLEDSPDWLNPSRTLKVSRRQVTRTLLGAFLH